MAEDTEVEITIETLTGTVYELRISIFETFLGIKARIQRLEGDCLHASQRVKPCLARATCLVLVSLSQGCPCTNRSSCTTVTFSAMTPVCWSRGERGSASARPSVAGWGNHRVRGVSHQLLWCSLLPWPRWSFQDTGRSSLAAASGNARWTHTDGSRCVCVRVYVCHR